MSPVRSSGVVPLQQKPPGWLTSMTPSKTRRVAGSSCGESPGAVLMTLPSRTTSTVTRSSWAYPATSTKSRDGNSVNARPPAGGSLTGTAAAGVGHGVRGDPVRHGRAVADLVLRVDGVGVVARRQVLIDERRRRRRRPVVVLDVRDGDAVAVDAVPGHADVVARRVPRQRGGVVVRHRHGHVRGGGG